MKNVLLILSTICCAFLANAQTVNGTIVDAESGEPLIGASVLVTNTTTGTITDFEGNFELNVKQAGDYTLLVTYTGYADKGVDVSAGTTQLGNIGMDFNSVGLKGVELIASVAVDRRTPVAVSTLKGDEIEAIIGNQEFPEVLRKTPSIYVTKEGGGFGDARINVRGFDQTNVAVMINGIPVNDMENGRVFWSNWAGLADVTSTMQVQRGLGASKLAVPSVGGSINIITDAAKLKSGGTATATIGNDGYQKYGFALSSGLLDNGWAFTMQGTHTRGDGYIDGTQFRAFSYFGSISKVFNDQHTLTATVLGAPQLHNQRSFSRFDNGFTLRTMVDPDDPNNEDPTTGVGIRFNPLWGTLDGEEFSFRKNFYHKPKAFINHYWNINSNMELKTSLYASYGWGGGTGPRGRLRTPGSVFDSFGGFGRGIHNQDGQVRWDDIVAYNQGATIDGFGDAKEQLDGRYVVTADGRVYGDQRTDQGSGFIRRASMNNHSWYGGLSTLTVDINPSLNFVGGLDARYYKGEHYRRVENLLGADAYLSRSDDNNPQNFVTEPSPAEFGNFYDPSYKDGNNVINYWNDGLVSWLGLFGQVEYTSEKVSTFLSLSASNQGFKRIDYFNYLDSDPERETDWQNFWGGTLKTGLNYNINENHNVFVNAGGFSRQPIFDNVFLNFRNDINDNIENQLIYAFEAGYGLRSDRVDANINYYYTNWGNRQFDRSFNQIVNDSTQFDALALFRGVDQRHQGIEAEVTYRVAKGFELNGMLSLGDWEYTSDFTADITNTDTGEKVGVETLFADGLKVGDAAQTTLNIGAVYRTAFGLRVYADYYFADNLFANYDIFDDQFFSPGAEIVQLPSYSLVDAGASYNFTLGGLNLTLRANINNVLDETYIAELDTNILDNPDTPQNELYDNQGFFGFGRTWNMGLKVRF